MTEKLHIADTTAGEALLSVGGVSFLYGASSPYPTESATPVPSASFQIAGDVENLYRIGNKASIETRDTNATYTREVFSGTLATSSDMPISTMKIDHVSNKLNMDIRTWPIITRSDRDTSEGRKSLVELLRHIYSECGVNEYGVTGDFQFGVTNSFPGVAYYDHPTDRFFARHVPSLTELNWTKDTPISADPGISFGKGESFTFIIKSNNNYGRGSEGEIAPSKPQWGARFQFEQGSHVFSTEENPNKNAFLSIEYIYATRLVKLTFGRYDGGGTYTTEYTFNADNDLPEYPGSLDYVVVELTNNGDSTLNLTMYCYNRSVRTEIIDSIIPVNVFANQVSLKQAWFSMAGDDFYTPDVGAREGVQAVYILKGTDWAIREEDKFPINFPWFSRPDLANLALPSLSGNGWQLVQEVCQTFGLSLDAMHSQYTLLSSMNYTVPWVTGLGAGVGVQASERELAERVEVVSYDYDVVDLSTGNYINLYKADQVFSVRKGELFETTIQLPEGSDYTLIRQPECFSPSVAIDYWNRTDDQIQASLYSVFDDDNLEVDRNSWINSGGAIWVERTENIGELKLFIQAPHNDLLSKGDTFHISAAGSDIPILQIAGWGMRSKQKTISIRTGVPRRDNLKKVGTTYDNKLVVNDRVAYDVGAGLAALHGTTATEASGTFQTEEATTFELAPILKHGAFYFPTSITASPTGTVQISGAVRFTPTDTEADTWKNLTCAQYEAMWPEGTTCRMQNISPLGLNSF